MAITVSVYAFKFFPDSRWKSHIRWEYWKALLFLPEMDNYSSRASQMGNASTPALVTSVRYTRWGTESLHSSRQLSESFNPNPFSHCIRWNLAVLCAPSLNSTFNNANTELTACHPSSLTRPKHILHRPLSNPSATRTCSFRRFTSDTEYFSSLPLLAEQPFLQSLVHDTV